MSSIQFAQAEKYLKEDGLTKNQRFFVSPVLIEGGKMYRGTASTVIDCPVESVYSVAENYPCFVSFYKRGSRIIFQDERQLKVEIHANLFKIFPTSWQGEGMKEKNKGLHFRQTKGLFKGLKADWSFEPIHGKTKVSITTTFSKPWLTSFVETWLGNAIVQNTTHGILAELKNKSEAQANP